MPIIKIKPIRIGLKECLDYIKDENKTDAEVLKRSLDYIDNEEKNVTENLELITTFGCNKDSPEIDFIQIKEEAKKVVGTRGRQQKNNVIAWHIIQSFDPNVPITASEVHSIGNEFAERFLGNNYQYVLTTHVDKKHLHNHIIFNSTSFKNYKKFDLQKNNNFKRLREINNQICLENNLSITYKVGDETTYPTIKENRNSLYKNKERSFKSILKKNINLVSRNSTSFDDFINKMESIGYEIINEKNTLKIKNNSKTYFTNIETLGETYTKKSIEDFIEKNKLNAKKLQKVLSQEAKTDIANEELLSPNEMLKTNNTQRTKLKYCIDYCIFHSKTFNEFIQKMQEVGYSIKFGKHIAFKTENMSKYIRAKSLGENYTEEAIKLRIEELDKPIPELIPDEVKDLNKHKRVNKKEPIKNNPFMASGYKIHTFKNGQFITTRSDNPDYTIKEVEKMIDISGDLKYQFNYGLKLWAEKHNLEQYLKTNRYIKSNNIKIANLSILIIDLENEINKTNNTINKLKDQIKVNKVIKNRISNNKDELKKIEERIEFKTAELKLLYEKNKKDKDKLNNLKIVSHNLAIMDKTERKL